MGALGGGGGFCGGWRGEGGGFCAGLRGLLRLGADWVWCRPGLELRGDAGGFCGGWRGDGAGGARTGGDGGLGGRLGGGGAFSGDVFFLTFFFFSGSSGVVTMRGSPNSDVRPEWSVYAMRMWYSVLGAR